MLFDSHNYGDFNYKQINSVPTPLLTIGRKNRFSLSTTDEADSAISCIALASHLIPVTDDVASVVSPVLLTAPLVPVPISATDDVSGTVSPVSLISDLITIADDVASVVSCVSMFTPLPVGMVIEWSGSIASIPAGFQLSDGTNGSPDLRDRFVVGAGSTYSVGATGGTTTHTHANVSGNGSASLSAGNHLKAQPPSGIADTGASLTFPPTTSTVASNTPPYYAAAYIYTTISGAIPPSGIVKWSGSIATIPAGFQLCNGTNGTPDLRDDFIVGAGSAYAVGATGGNSLHFHTVTLQGYTALRSASIILGGGTGLPDDCFTSIIWNAIGLLANVSNQPPYYALAYIQNISGTAKSVVKGIVAEWSGSIATIPAGWALCNGTNSPDLRNKFVICAGSTYAVNATGGTATHTHGLVYNGSCYCDPAKPPLKGFTPAGNISSTGTLSGSGAPLSGSNLPIYYALAYVIKS